MIVALRGRMLILVLLAMAVPLIWLIGDAVGDRRRDSEAAAKQLADAARAASQSTASAIEITNRVLAVVAEQDRVPVWHTDLCPALLAIATLGVPELASAGLTDSEGRVYCRTPVVPQALSVADREWFASLRGGGGFVVSDRFVSRATGRWVITAATPLRNEAPGFAGAAFIQIDLARLQRRWSERALAAGSFMALIGRDGRLIVATHNAHAARAMPPAAEIVRGIGSPDSTFEARGLDGVLRAYSIAPLYANATETFLLAGRPRSQLLGDTYSEFAVRVSGLLAALFAALLVVWFALHRLVLAGVQRLHETALAFAQGSRDTRVGDLYGSAPEIAQLGQVLDGLIETVNFQQEDLESSLDQKTSLLREVHHRVKNNLQIIISMLNLQGRAAGDAQLAQALSEAAGRVNALAIVHRRLYESHDLDRVDLDWFLRDLVTELQRIGRGDRRRIGIEVANARYYVTAQLAVPIGLLVTEAVTNALKYAFVGREGGSIEVSVSTDGDQAALVVRDDGIGLAPGRRTTGLGITLMEGFARQLEGVLHLESQHGTTVRVVFPRRQLQSETMPAERAPAGSAQPATTLTGT